MSKCDVCGTTENIAGVASSSLGAFSACFCKECLSKGAEPLWAIEYHMEGCPKGTPAKDVFRVEFLKAITYFKDGKYVSLEDYTV